MMYSIPLDDPEDTDEDWSFIAHTSDAYGQAPEFIPRHSEDTNLSDAESDEEYAAHLRGDLAPGKKKGGYDSRIEQILYENPLLPILITDAGKSSESGGKYIVYTIRTGVCHLSCSYHLY
jgi:sorting nexin-41/42